jgi:hypothetical protein
LIIRDPGHRYQLRVEEGLSPVFLQFVKTKDGKQCGTTNAEVVRALINRTQFLEANDPQPVNEGIILLLRLVLYDLEYAEAKLAGRELPDSCDPGEIETYPVCSECGHIFCRHMS